MQADTRTGQRVLTKEEEDQKQVAQHVAYSEGDIRYASHTSSVPRSAVQGRLTRGLFDLAQDRHRLWRGGYNHNQRGF